MNMNNSQANGDLSSKRFAGFFLSFFGLFLLAAYILPWFFQTLIFVQAGELDGILYGFYLSEQKPEAVATLVLGIAAFAFPLAWILYRRRMPEHDTASTALHDGHALRPAFFILFLAFTGIAIGRNLAGWTFPLNNLIDSMMFPMFGIGVYLLVTAHRQSERIVCVLALVTTIAVYAAQPLWFSFVKFLLVALMVLVLQRKYSVFFLVLAGVAIVLMLHPIKRSPFTLEQLRPCLADTFDNMLSYLPLRQSEDPAQAVSAEVCNIPPSGRYASSLLRRLSLHERYFRTTQFVPAQESFQNGSTLEPLLYAVIPRVFFPSKPREELGNDFGRRFKLLNPWDKTTSENVPWTAELYWNFGYLGSVAGFAVLGALLAGAIVCVGRLRNVYVRVGMFGAIVPLVVQESNISLLVGNAIHASMGIMLLYAGLCVLGPAVKRVLGTGSVDAK